MTHAARTPDSPSLLDQAPRSPERLRQWLRAELDLEVPARALVDGASTPFDYLCHAFLTDFQPTHPPSSDAIVWACRGGGKTFYAAVATALDLLFKPGIEIKILAGSLDQSARMYEHLRRIFERPRLAPLVDGRITTRRLRLINDSRAETLAQSHTSIRGARPQKLRCDEVELFDPDIWRAAQLVTRSKRCGQVLAQGAIEALSTMHRPGGLMSTLVGHAQTHDPLAAPNPAARTLFRWSVLDVLEVCPPSRPCETCDLHTHCAGKAKRESEPAPAIGGHITISDALVLKSRADQATWESEMLCLRPQRSDSVFPEFDPAIHVAPFDSPLHSDAATWLAGMDFGFRDPTVILWAFLDRSSGMLRIIDEHVESERILAAHIKHIKHPRPHLRIPEWIACDPAGHQRSDQTGQSAIAALRCAGLNATSSYAPIDRGLRAIRRRLAPASGPPTLSIHPRCRHLIEALHAYHYPVQDQRSLTPVKDGPDHTIDALRYLITSLETTNQSNRVLSYL